MTIKSNKRVLFIIICSKKDVSKDNFLALQMPEISLLAKADTKIIEYHNKPNKSIYYWSRVNELIKNNYQDYDGFIVIKEPDSLIFSALATQTALIKNSKPIIFTTAPFEDGDFNLVKNIYQIGLKTNIINSLQLISAGIPEVMIVYGQKVMTADKAKKISTSELNAYQSIDDDYLAEIDLSISIKKEYNMNSKAVKMVNKFDDQISFLYLHPGFHWTDYPRILRKSKALIVKSNRQRGLTKYDYQYLEKYFVDKPIVLFNKLGLIDEQIPSNYILVKNMTWEEVIVRTMWCLAQAKELKKFKKLFQK
jgi:L-asparaginase